MTRWELQHYTSADGWQNANEDRNGQPLWYATEAEARCALQAWMTDLREDPESQDMLDYDEDSWRVQTVEIQ